MKNPKRSFILTTVFFVLHLPFLAQNIDSLKIILSKASHDTMRIKILNTLSETAPDNEWPLFNKQMLDLAEKKIKQEPGNKFYLKYLAAALNNTGLTWQNKGDIPKALEYNLRALKIYEETGDKSGTAYALNNLGFLYFNLGDIKKSLEYQHSSLKIQEQTNNKFGIASALNFIALIYEGQGEIDKALEYYLRALSINEEINNKSGIALGHNNIGFIYKNRNEPEEALRHLHKASLIYKETNNAEGYATALVNIGTVYKIKNDNDKALQYFMNALKIQEAINDKKGMAACLHNVGYIYYIRNDYSHALEYTLHELKVSQDLGFPKLISDAAFLLKCVYQKQNNYEKALQMSDLYLYYKDSVNNEENRKATIKKQLQYVFEKKATADSVKTAEEKKVKDAEIKAGKAQLAQEKITRYSLFGGLALVIIFFILLFNRFRTIQKQKGIIETQKAEVEKQKETVLEKQKEILDSIYYAKRIQTALLTPEKFIDRSLKKLNKKA
ncbi:MAG: tetratricopeptide repeat protein [Bacteroidia bacterium]